jgi:hypothetical protein
MQDSRSIYIYSTVVVYIYIVVFYIYIYIVVFYIYIYILYMYNIYIYDTCMCVYWCIYMYILAAPARTMRNAEC